MLNVEINRSVGGEDLVNVLDSVHNIDKGGHVGGAVRYDHSPQQVQAPNPKDMQEKEKWKVVMKFMKSNPQVILEMVTPPEERAATDI